MPSRTADDPIVASLAVRRDRLYYDGTCGLCHGAVRFILRRDGEGARFRFAPLNGPTFLAEVPESRRAGLPGSLVLQTRDGELLTRSDAVIRIMRTLGGGWKATAWLLGALPRPLRDGCYDLVARRRFKFFGRTATSCPAPASLSRFDP